MAPQIDACGFIDVSKRLVPTVILFQHSLCKVLCKVTPYSQLIGTTLTYVLIMVQFLSQEVKSISGVPIEQAVITSKS